MKKIARQYAAYHVSYRYIPPLTLDEVLSAPAACVIEPRNVTKNVFMVKCKVAAASPAGGPSCPGVPIGTRDGPEAPVGTTPPPG